MRGTLTSILPLRVVSQHVQHPSHGQLPARWTKLNAVPDRSGRRLVRVPTLAASDNPLWQRRRQPTADVIRLARFVAASDPAAAVDPGTSANEVVETSRAGRPDGESRPVGNVLSADGDVEPSDQHAAAIATAAGEPHVRLPSHFFIQVQGLD
jgi:hypothetical protein